MKKVMKVNILIKGETFVDVIPLSRGKRESLNYKDNQIPVYTVLNVDSDKLNHIVKETIKGYDIGEYDDIINVHVKLEDILK